MKLLVIDIQKGITDSRLFNFDEFINNTSRIIQAARDNQIEVIYFQHDDGPGTGFSIGDEEFEIAEQVHPREGEKIFTKNINSCCLPIITIGVIDYRHPCNQKNLKIYLSTLHKSV